MNSVSDNNLHAMKGLNSAHACPGPDPRLKPLVWEARGGDNFRAKCPLFGSIRVENYSTGFIVLWSVPGYCDTFIDGNFSDAAQALRAAEQEFQRRMAEFLS